MSGDLAHKELPVRTPFGYAFAGATLELARGRLLVDGQDAGAGPLVLKLLAVLCQAAGLLVTRQRLFDEIWPRQTVSDEALTKLIARLRETLGPYGKCVVTLRARGVRLDAAVTELDAPLETVAPSLVASAAAPAGDVVPAPANEALAAVEEIAPPAPTAPVAPAPLPPRRVKLSGINLLGTIAALLILAALAWGIRILLRPATPDPQQTVVSDFGLTVADVNAARPETLDLLRDAVTALHLGQTERYRAVLQVAHDADHATMVPGILLSLSRGLGPNGHDSELEEDIAARLGESTTPYVRLLARYAHDFHSRADDGEPRLAALVAMRPSAWRLQLRLAHIALGQRREAVALKALRQIPVTGVPPDISMTALADRASLGDTQTVTDLLDAGAFAQAPTYREHALGRLDWTHSQVDAAIAHLDKAAEIASHDNDFWREINARELAALFAFHAGHADAASRLERTITLIRRTTIHLDEVDALEALAAELQLASNPAGARERLRGIAARDQGAFERIALEIQNARLGFVLPEGSFTSREQQPAKTAVDYPGAAELTQAWTAHARGDPDTARQQLGQARSLGIDDSYFREDAALLDARLSKRSYECRPDPPYPNALRFSTCRGGIGR